LQAVILGRAEGDDSAMSLPDIFEDVGLFLYVANVTIRFRRRGMWLHTEATASSSATNNGDIATMTLSALTYQSPTKITVTNVSNKSGNYTPPTIAVSDSASDIVAVNAKLLTIGSAPFTLVNDTSRNARGGTILRYTPAGTAEATPSVYGDLSGMTVSCRTAAILVNYRNNSATDSFTITPYIRYGSSAQEAYGKKTILPAAASPYPKWILLDIISFPSYASDFLFNVSSSGTVGTLDIDSFVFVNVGNPAASILSNTLMKDSILGGTLTVDHRQLTNVSSAVAINSYPSGYLGDPTFCTKGSAVCGVLLQTGGSAIDMWRESQPGTSSIYQNTWTAARYTNYLVPR
jgi:hypothetical protein